MSHVDLTTKIGKTLTLSNPFWIASSHYSENSAILKSWRDYAPAAMTLKTCTKMDRTEPAPKSTLRLRTQPFLPRYGRAFYCDGPKTKELKSYEEARDLLIEAGSLLRNTKIGISVLATDFEDFGELRALCPGAHFWELNLKYSMRTKTVDEPFFGSRQTKWAATLDVVKRFLNSFHDLPAFVKLPRELEWLPSTEEALELLDALRAHGDAGLVIANSRKTDIAGFIAQDEEQSLRGGVLCGDPLYDGSLAMIEGLKPACELRSIPVVASGGMVDEQQVLMAIRAGADAVQLCTAFDYNNMLFYPTLVAGLTSRMKWRGMTDMKTYVNQLRKEGIASVYSIPFGYSSSFWAEEFQKNIQQDVRLSGRMDVLVISGKTLYQKWSTVLTERVETRKRSIRALHLDPDSTAFAVVQETWGIAGSAASQAQRERPRAAMEWLRNLFGRGREALILELKKDEAFVDQVKHDLAGLSAAELFSEIQTENRRRQREGAVPLPCPEWAAAVYDKCPFYSMYIFDDKAHVAMYPFVEPGEAASPVYTYPRSSKEYERLLNEFDTLWRYSQQTMKKPTVLADRPEVSAETPRPEG